MSINAYSYTILAAFEYCIDHQMLGIVAAPQNFSSSQTYTAIGMNSVPYYHRRGRVSYSTEYYSYPVTSVYPNFVSGFECRTQFKDFVGSPELEVLSRELVHDVSKDYRGGLLVKSSKDSKTFQSDDVLIRVNGVRVEQTTEIRDALEKLDSAKVNVDVIRSQEIIHLSAQVKDLTPNVKADQTKIIELTCKNIPANEYMNAFDQRPVGVPKICESIVANCQSSATNSKG